MKKRLLVAAVFVLAVSTSAGAAVPGPPQNLDVIVHDNTVTLTWSPPLAGEMPTSYLVRASLSPGGPVIASILSTNTTQVVTNVPDGVYYVHVVAQNAEGVGAASNEIVVLVPGGSGPCTARPDPPANFAASVAGNVVTLTWAAPPTGCRATAYAVQAGSASGLSNIAVLNVGSQTSLTVAAPPGTYFVRIIGLNGFGGSVASPEIVVTVPSS